MWLALCIYEGETVMKMMCLVYLFYQLNEASAALQKTSQQVQKLVNMAHKPSPGVSLLRSPGQPPFQSGEHALKIIRCIFLLGSIIYLKVKVCVHLSTLQVFRVQCQQCLYHRLHLSPYASPTQTW